MFDPILLRSLLAVGDAGSFTRAAEKLNLTQSAVSAHVRRLEAEAGQRLIERTTRSVALTPAGGRLSGYARTILALHEDARASLGGARALAGNVTIGLSEEMAQPSVLDSLRRFAAVHADVTVALTIGFAGDLLAGLKSGAIDIMLGSRCSQESADQILWSEPLVWAAPPGFDVSDRAADPLPLAAFPDACPYRAAAIAALTRAGRRWRLACEAPSLSALAAAVRGGFGVAPMTRSLAVAAGLAEIEALPVLPDARFLLLSVPRPSPVAAKLGDELRRCVWNSAMPVTL